VKVLDEKYFATPDQPGNKWVDSYGRLPRNPCLAILFMAPGKGETSRITGEARIVREVLLHECRAVVERVPEFAILMHVESARMAGSSGAEPMYRFGPLSIACEFLRVMAYCSGLVDTAKWLD
jgi:hypothetical protein